MTTVELEDSHPLSRTVMPKRDSTSEVFVLIVNCGVLGESAPGALEFRDGDVAIIKQDTNPS